jgi:hypothetical protein
VAVGAWPLLFLAAAPLAVWAAVRARHLPPSGARTAVAEVDWAGAGLLVLTITLLALILNHPHTTASDLVMPVFHQGLPLLALATAAAFLAVERRVRVPILDWAQLRDRPFAAAVAVNAILHLTMMAALFLGPLLVVRGLGLDTMAGGMLMVIVQTSVVATSLLGGWLHDRTRAPWIRPLACGVLGIGLLAWALAGWQMSYVGLLAAGFLAGLGSGLLLTTNNIVIMAALPGSARGVASGMLETTRHFGHAFGVTIPTAILALVTGAVGNEALAVREGFVVACIAMAAVAALGVLLATVQPTPRRAL